MGNHHDHHGPDLSAGNLTAAHLGNHVRNFGLAAAALLGFGIWSGTRSGGFEHFARAYLVCMMFALAKIGKAHV